jgi:hypothetical protein
MKIFLKNIVCISLSAWFIAAAVGYNIVKYCCSGCSQSEIKSEFALCENKKTAEEDNCCGGFAHEESDCTNENTSEHCALLYFKADFPAVENSINLKFEPKEFDLQVILAKNLSLPQYCISKTNSFLLSHTKIPLCGRKILAQSEILNI